MRKPVKLSEQAQEQLDEVFEYVEREFSTTVYKRVKQEIYGALALIELFPAIGTVVSQSHGIRRTTVRKVNCIYWTEKPQHIEVLAITRRGQAIRKGW